MTASCRNVNAECRCSAVDNGSVQCLGLPRRGPPRHSPRIDLQSAHRSLQLRAASQRRDGAMARWRDGAMGDGAMARWAMARWAMGDGRWAMGDGRWAMPLEHARHHRLRILRVRGASLPEPLEKCSEHFSGPENNHQTSAKSDSNNMPKNVQNIFRGCWCVGVSPGAYKQSRGSGRAEQTWVVGACSALRPRARVYGAPWLRGAVAAGRRGCGAPWLRAPWLRKCGG